MRPDDRDVTELIMADMTYQDVADHLSVPLGTVKARLSRARQVVNEHRHSVA